MARRGLFNIAAACCALSTAAAAPAVPQLQSVLHDGGALRLVLDRWPGAGEGTLVLWLGHSDLTALIQRRGSDLLLDASALALAHDARRLRVWLVHGENWHALDDRLLDALPGAPASAPAPAWHPRADLAIKGQAAGSHHGPSPGAWRGNHHDLTLRAALDGQAQLGDFALKGQAQLAGSSYRPEALRAASRAADAPKVDLAAYRVDLAGERGSVALGHVAVGTHPLLLSSWATRGVQGIVRPLPDWELSLAAVNGSAIVGFDNPLGIADADHRVVVATVAHELRPAEPGTLRAELSAIDAELRAQAGFNHGQVPDAERLNGVGLRLLGRAADSRLRWDLALAHNRYRPGDDAQLGTTAALVPLRTSSGNAYALDVAADLWRDVADAALPSVITLQARRLHVPPLYKTVGTFLAADQRADRLALAVQLGSAHAALFGERRHDNLDALPNLLRTGTRQHGLLLSLPAQVAAAASGTPSGWWPAITLQLARNRQLALNAPDFASSGIAPTHRPDQASRELRLALAWTIDRASLGYAVQHSRQDNRQPGREAADFLGTTHAARAAWTASDALQLALDASRGRQYSYERAAAVFNRAIGASLDWRLGDRWSLQGNASEQRTQDLAFGSAQRQRTLQTQLTQRFEWATTAGAPRPGQWFVRQAWLQSDQTQPAAGLATRAHHWALHAGVSLSWEALR